MRVQVRLLGAHRKYLPAGAQGSAYSLEVPANIRIEELWARLPVPAGEDQVILVNGRTPLSGQVLREGDTIAVFPALAGG